MVTVTNVLENSFNLTEIEHSFKLKGIVDQIQEVVGQSEICYCRGDFCNAASRPIISLVSVAISFAVLLL
jgi:hypothetical protein